MANKKHHQFGNPRTVVACIRVSREEQDLSPQAQAKAIEQYCQVHGLTLVATFIERATCSVTPLEERTALTAALSSLRPLDAGILLFLNRDRISRDVILTKLIERDAIRQGAVVATVAGLNGVTPQDELLRTIMDAIAQFERELLIQRTRDALQVKKDRGEYVGGLPYGYRWQKDGDGQSTGALVPHPEEQAIIQEAKRLHSEGMSQRKIAAALPLTRKGTPFTKTQISRILQA